MRSEIEYHNECIEQLISEEKTAKPEKEEKVLPQTEKNQHIEKSVEEKIQNALELLSDKK